MRASLTLNQKDQIALFYNEVLDFTPEWASIDIERGEIYLGSADENNKLIKLDHIEETIYGRVESEAQILLVRVENNKENTPLDTVFVPLMISRQP